MEGNDSESRGLEELIYLEMERNLDKNFDDVFGLEKCCDMLKENVVLPFRFPHLYTKPERTFMLYGSPGSGKSCLLSAAASASGAKLFVFNVWTLLSRRISGCTYAADDILKAVFKVAHDNAPSILCFEDIEVFNKSDMNAAKASFLNEVHNFLQNAVWDLVVVIGVTQVPWAVDSSIREIFSLTPGSHVTLLGPDVRLSLLKKLCEGTSLSLNHEQMATLASKTSGFTGADLTAWVMSAQMRQIARLSNATHFKKVLLEKTLSDKSRPSNKHPQDKQGVSQNERQVSSTSHPIPNQSAISDSNSDFAPTCEAKGTLDAACSKPSIQLDSQTGSSAFPIGKGSELFEEKFVPCDAEDVDAIPVSFIDLPSDKVQVYGLSMQDMEEELSRMKPSVDREELEKMMLFGSEYCRGAT